MNFIMEVNDSDIERWINSDFDSDSEDEEIDYAQLEAVLDECRCSDDSSPNESNISRPTSNLRNRPSTSTSTRDTNNLTNRSKPTRPRLEQEVGQGDRPKAQPRPKRQRKQRKDKEPAMVWESMLGYQPKRETFTGNSGPKIASDNILDIFEYFFDRELLGKIAENTNLYAEQERAKRGFIFKRFSREWNWVPVTVEELYIVLGMMLLMGIVQKPSLRAYYSKNPLLDSPIFPATMSLERLEQILKYLHFCDSTKLSTFIGPKKLFKIFYVIEHLNKKFKDAYELKQNVSIDESLTLWKGRLGFKQYIPLKASKFGIKTFELCESASGYTWNFLVYTGKDSDFQSTLTDKNTLKSTAIVMSLLEPILDKGHTVWMDNWYNSPDLSVLLKSRKTDTCGTLKLKRKNVPQEVKSTKLNKGEIVANSSKNVMVLKWRDKRVVTLISTFHNHEMKLNVKKTGQAEFKPELVFDYNKEMGGVDKRDQMLHSFLVERKRGRKWYMKLFKRMLNVTVLNSYIIHKTNKPRDDHLFTRLDLVKKIFEKYGANVSRPVVGRPSTEPRPSRLTERHFVEKILPTEKKQHPQKRCCVCARRKIRKDSYYWCPDCEAGLCLEPCFKDYHTKVNF